MKSIEWKDLDARCRKWEVRNQKLEIGILNAHIPFPTSHITFWDQTIEFCPKKWEMRFKRGFSQLKCSPLSDTDTEDDTQVVESSKQQRLIKTRQSAPCSFRLSFKQSFMLEKYPLISYWRHQFPEEIILCRGVGLGRQHSLTMH